MSEYHEPTEDLSEEARNFHRALSSLKEELEAVDWYHQRVDACADEELRAVLAHNRDEEIEHACMTLEWLRRNMPKWDQQLRTYLFTQERIEQIEEAAPELGGGKGSGPGSGREDERRRNSDVRSLGVGSLRGEP